MRGWRWWVLAGSGGLLALLVLSQVVPLNDTVPAPERPSRAAPAVATPSESKGPPPIAETPGPAEPNPSPVVESPPTEEEKADRFNRVLQLTEYWSIAVRHGGSLQREILEEITAALRGDDGVLIEAAMYTFARTLLVEFDRTPFRAAVIGFLKSEDERLRAAALFGLAGLRPTLKQLDDIRPLVSDPSPRVRKNVTHVLRRMAGRKIEGELEKPFLDLLRDRDPNVVREAMSATGDMAVAPSISNELLRLAKSEDPEVRHQAVYFGLSQLNPKSEAVVDALLALLEHESFTESHRAVWGLGTGVPDSLHRKVADAALASIPRQTLLQMQADVLDLVRLYGDDTHLPKLDAMVNDDETPVALHQRAVLAIAAIRDRAQSR